MLSSASTTHPRRRNGPGLRAAPLRPDTLATHKDAGIRIRPENLHVALRELAGIADRPMSKQFPLVFPEKEKLRGFWG